jgi:hypothetical protein
MFFKPAASSISIADCFMSLRIASSFGPMLQSMR